ncbi:MAG: hypothetical protein ACRCVT_15590, partial [Leadbetterella sp.]
MPKKQIYLIGVFVAIFLYIIAQFRLDFFIYEGHPRISQMATVYGSQIMITLSFALLFIFLAKLFNLKWYTVLLVFMGIELVYAIFIFQGANFLPESFKGTALAGHIKKITTQLRPMIQFDDHCSQYSKDLFYTLKPGNSRFKGYEFDTKYSINSLGFRDSEVDTQAPEILFLGDSFTMGWGVEKNECFESLVQSKTGLKCLNTGVSSYGTAREYKNFEKVDKSNLKAIIIQFHETDLEENQFFVKSNYISSKKEIDLTQLQWFNEKAKTYMPFKFLNSAIYNLKTKKETALQNVKNPFPQYPNYEKDFYTIVSKMRSQFKGPIIILSIGSFYTDNVIIDDLKSYNQDLNIHFTEFP